MNVQSLESKKDADFLSSTELRCLLTSCKCWLLHKKPWTHHVVKCASNVLWNKWFEVKRHHPDLHRDKQAPARKFTCRKSPRGAGEVRKVNKTTNEATAFVNRLVLE